MQDKDFVTGQLACLISCTGGSSRGAIAMLDDQGTGLAVWVYTSSQAVRTEERMGLDKIGADFPNQGVSANSQVTPVVSGYTVAGMHPFWATGYEEAG